MFVTVKRERERERKVTSLIDRLFEEVKLNISFKRCLMSNVCHSQKRERAESNIIDR